MSAIMGSMTPFPCSESDGFSAVSQVTCSIFDNSESYISLRDLKVGQHARVVRVQADGELGRRIRDMGLIPGIEITVVGRAPLKDPVALRLLGFTLSLRNNEADYVIVLPIT